MTDDAPEPAAAFIGLGANLGNAGATLRAAVAAMAELPGTTLVALSSYYLSAPVDASGPDYLNAVAWLATGLTPHVLLIELQRIELQHGRERPSRNAPRTLDLDLLLYGDERIATPTLTVPHPRLHQRAFVLLPLLEISPEVVSPAHGRLADAWPAVADQRLYRLPG